MSITSFVNYENEIEFKPTWPDSDEEIGITFWLKSRQCDAAIAISSSYTKDTIKDQIKARSGGKKDGGADDMADRAASRIIEQSPKIDAACVSRWDLNGMTLFSEDDVKKDGTKFTKSNVEKVFLDRRSAWIAAQLSEAISGIENFTKPLKKG